jgi:hypothetical protein
MSFVFKNQYGWNETQTGLAFLGIGGGSLLGLYVVYLWSDRIAAALTKRHGIQKPEVDSLCNCADFQYRLVMFCFSQFLMPCGLLIYGWSSEFKWHW